MADGNIHIAIIEPSDIIFEGLSNILLRRSHLSIFRLDHLNEAFEAIGKEKLDIIVVNPSILQSQKTLFLSLKKGNPQVCWIGLVYSFWQKEALTQFDEIIQITDSIETIGVNIHRQFKLSETVSTEPVSGQLSDRERDVLIQLVNGKSNKEIADTLNISIHTVVSHRKNITQKTGIKSQSGLTIFAISNKIVSLDNLSL